MLTQLFALACLAAPPKIATGTIESLTSRSVTIAAKGAGTLKLSYDSDTDVTVDGQRSEGEKIPKGSSVSVTYDPEELYAKKLRCVSPAGQQARTLRAAKAQMEREEKAAQEAEIEAAASEAERLLAEKERKEKAWQQLSRSVADESILGETKTIEDGTWVGLDYLGASALHEAWIVGVDEVNAVSKRNAGRNIDWVEKGTRFKVTKCHNERTNLENLAEKKAGPRFVKGRITEVPAKADQYHPKVGDEVFVMWFDMEP